MNVALYQKELKGSLKLLFLFGAVLTMYIVMIISMYDPELSEALKQFEKTMPDLMAAVGMTNTGTTLPEFMASYLYGMILLIFPMIYSIIRANGLIAKYVDRGSMASLLAAPVTRMQIARTQLAVLISGITVLIVYCTVLEYTVARIMFPDELALQELLRLNTGLLCLQLFMGAYCFLCSCFFSESRFSLAFGAGLPVFMYVLQMLANMGGKLESIRYLTFFTLFDTEGLLCGDTASLLGIIILFCFAVCFSISAFIVFKRKDLCV